MLIVVLVLAVIGLAVLAAAILTGNTILALVVIAVAALGLVLLARDWFKERRRLAGASADADAEPAEHHEHPPGATREKRPLAPDMFEPDVSYEEAEEPEEAGEAQDAQEAEHHGAGREGATE
jgi:hypothetical protein